VLLANALVVSRFFATEKGKHGKTIILRCKWIYIVEEPNAL